MGGACVQHVLRADGVRIDVGIRLRNALGRPGARGQMEDCGGAVALELGIQATLVRNVRANEAESGAVLELSEPPMLDDWVVGVVQAVEPDNLIAGVEQLCCQPMTDEACRPGDYVCRHALSPCFQRRSKCGAEVPLSALRVSSTSGAASNKRW